MRGLTIQQPYATLTALGLKELETRSWRTNYRGPVALHASAQFPGWCRKIMNVEPFHSALQRDGKMLHLPLGKVVAIAEIVDCYLVTETFCRGLSRREYAFGNYQIGRFAFRLANVRRLRNAVSWKGALGFWRVPEDLQAQLVYEVAAA